MLKLRFLSLSSLQGLFCVSGLCLPPPLKHGEISLPFREHLLGLGQLLFPRSETAGECPRDGTGTNLGTIPGDKPWDNPWDNPWGQSLGKIPGTNSGENPWGQPLGQSLGTKFGDNPWDNPWDRMGHRRQKEQPLCCHCHQTPEMRTPWIFSFKVGRTGRDTKPRMRREAGGTCWVTTSVGAGPDLPAQHLSPHWWWLLGTQNCQ